MVLSEWCSFYCLKKLVLFCSGVEHHVPQLADVRAAAVGDVHVDVPKPAQDDVAHLTVPRAVRRVPARSAVRVRHEPHR